MKNLLIKNIGTLVSTYAQAPNKVAGAAMKEIPMISNAYLLIENGKIKAYGTMDTCPERADKILDAKGGWILPAFCDSHTHLVFATSRETEFIDKVRGLSYEEIAAKGGGILNSARKLQELPEEVLFERALVRLHEVIGQGTGAIEIKSGYGLTLDAELKMLRVIRKLKELNLIPIKSTFLGAHAFPLEYRNNREAYIKLITEEMMPRVAGEQLADYCDVFCEKGFFSVAETDRILEAGAKYGLKAKIHANQLDFSGGVQIGVQHKAISVDHLEHAGENEIVALLNSNTIGTLLPAAAFFLRLPYPPARQMIDAGLAVALATDYNPGSCPSGRMSFVLSLACLYMKMLPEEAFNAATINGAYAMELTETVGSITEGKLANLILTKPIPSLAYIPYNFGGDVIDTVIINGQVQ